MAAASVSRERLLQLTRIQCNVFSQTYNPSRARLGNKVLRQRLRGPKLASYYPKKSATFEDIQKEFAKLNLTTWDEQEEERVEYVRFARLRGKGAPKKKRTAAQGNKRKGPTKK